MWNEILKSTIFRMMRHEEAFMSDNTNEYQVLLDVVRQNYASVVWTHKIQIKQADIYATRYRRLENFNVILAAATSCGAVSIFADQDSFVLKIATVILSFITTAVTTYLKRCCRTFSCRSQRTSASNWRNSYAGKVC